MSKWIVCVLISSLSGSLIYGMWIMLSGVLRRRGNITVLYHTLRTVTVMFVVLALGGILWAVYMQLYPTNTLWPIEPTYMRLFLYWLSTIWMIGAAYKVVNYAREYNLLAQRVKGLQENHGYEYDMLQQISQEMKIRKIPKLLTGYDVATPELFGLFKPVIILTEELLTDLELKHIYLHELFHLKYCDRLIRELAVLVHCIHWFNPFLTRILNDLEKVDELHCDACVCDAESADKRIYASVLYKFSERAVKHNKQILKVTFVEKGENMLERMKFIESHRKGVNNKKWLTVMLASLFIVCSTTVALGATDGMVSLYDASVVASSKGTVENMQDDTLVEYREYVGTELYEELMAENDDISPNALPTAYISTNLDGNWNSGAFWATAGQEIVVQVTLVPKNVNIKIGIAEPDGWLRYLYNCGVISHTFILTKTGNYEVFMINETDQTVTVVGNYCTVTPY